MGVEAGLHSPAGTLSVKLALRALLPAILCLCGMLPAALGQPIPDAGEAAPDPADPGVEAPVADDIAEAGGNTVVDPAGDATPVSAETVEDPFAEDPVVAGPPPLPPSWFETRIAIEELAESGDFEAALDLQEHLLTLAAAEFGEPSPQVAEAHLLIAGVLRQNDQFRAAEGEILNAIQVYEDVAGPMSVELIEPYLRLGENYSDAGDFASALSSYGEARTIGRREYGLLNESQIDIIDDMSAAAEELGQVEEAGQLQLDALIIVERNHTATSLEAIEANYRYADWLRDHYQNEEALHVYYQIESIIKDHYASDPLMTVRLLRERSRTLRIPMGDMGGGVPRSSLADALEILEGMPEPPPLLMAEVLVEMGDWQVEYARTRVPSDYYVRAWGLLGQVENGDELRRQWFDELVPIDLPRISQRGLTEDTDAPAGFVIVYFTVDESGHTQDIEITDSQPPGLKDSAVLQVIRVARFRPRVVDGEIVAVRRGYRFPFHYLPPTVEEAE
jgi:TonB family protein